MTFITIRAAALGIILLSIGACVPTTRPESQSTAGGNAAASVDGPQQLCLSWYPSHRNVQIAMLGRFPRDAGSALRRLLDFSGRPGVPDFAKDSDVTVALHATWVQNAKAARDPSDPEGRRLSESRIEPAGAARFLAALKRIGQVSPPAWWATAFADPFADRTVRPSRNTPSGLLTHDAISLNRKDNTLVIGSGDRAIAIPDQLLKEEGETAILDSIACRFADERCYVAFYNDSVPEPDSYPLWCFDARTGERLWTTRVWGALHGAHYESFGPEIIVTEDRVFVFGMGFARYAECFDRKTGAALWRFNSEFWGAE